jgi:8-oxo-dGTP pyrophosphatase MutT (NUDIX family)
MKDRLRDLLGSYEPQRITQAASADAAVLVLLYDHRGEPHMVFQKRSAHVLHHKGQISFPGGAVDPTDPDHRFTALRETHEEMGVRPEHVDVFGQIDDILTISDFRVTPFVGWLQEYPYEFRYPADEVAYLLEVPVEHLFDRRNFVPDRRTIDGKEVILPAYRFRDELIWGATARMLTNFLDLWSMLDPLGRVPPASTLVDRRSPAARDTMLR